MKKLIFPAMIAMAAFAVSCKDEKSYEPMEEAMRDSIFAAYPTTVASIKLHVTDKTDLRIVLGGQSLYATAPAEKQKMAEDLGRMAVRIFGKDSYLKTGALVVTKDERNTQDNPADGISNKIDFEGLKK